MSSFCASSQRALVTLDRMPRAYMLALRGSSDPFTHHDSTPPLEHAASAGGAAARSWCRGWSSMPCRQPWTGDAIGRGIVVAPGVVHPKIVDFPKPRKHCSTASSPRRGSHSMACQWQSGTFQLRRSAQIWKNAAKLTLFCHARAGQNLDFAARLVHHALHGLGRFLLGVFDGLLRIVVRLLVASPEVVCALMTFRV